MVELRSSVSVRSDQKGDDRRRLANQRAALVLGHELRHDAESDHLHFNVAAEFQREQWAVDFYDICRFLLKLLTRNELRKKISILTG